MTPPWLLLGIAAALLPLSAWFSRWFSTPGSWFYILDHPNTRSLHHNPTPRSGGVAITAAFGAGWLAAALWFPPFRSTLWIGAGGLFLAGVSYLDDRRHLPAPIRLGAHLGVASVAVGQGLLAPVFPWPALDGLPLALPPAAAEILSLLFIVWCINLYNFMDGMDGFAGGMALFGFGWMAWMGWQGGHLVFGVLNAMAACSAAGFLWLNFPPARLFMGDAGSSLLGYLAAVFSLWGALDGVAPLWAFLLVFSPFWVDATVTLIHRGLKGEKVWVAHKTHYYQRLVQLGWGHRKTVLAEYGLMALTGGSALWGVGQDPAAQQVLLAGWGGVYGVLMGLIHWRERLTPPRQ
ncbi:MAG: glycosyltransferase family 4 protein [Deltaproteobacteria bacterium]|nr:glycosyltransferase family 4 protein [Deltaproteobacteria bacterium]